MRHLTRHLWILIPIFAAVLLFWATFPYKAGISPDSMVYLSMAHHIHAGKGTVVYLQNFMETSQPIAAWPPLLVWIFGGFFALGIDPLYSSWLLNVVLYGVNIALCGFFVLRGSGSPLLALVCALALLGNPEWTSYHAWILSEPLFLVWTNLGLWFLWRFFKFSKTRDLICAGLFTSLAPMTRYIGVAFIAAGCLSILLLYRESIKNRLIKTGYFGLMVSVPLGLWLVRNYLVTDPGYYSLKEKIFGTLVHYFDTRISWLATARSSLDAFAGIMTSVPSAVPKTILLLTVALASLWAIFFSSKNHSEKERGSTMDPYLPAMLLIYGAVYTWMLVTGLWFTNFIPDIPFRYQFSSAAHFTCLIFLFVYFLYSRVPSGFRKKGVKVLGGVICLVWVIAHSGTVKEYFLNLREQGADGTRGGIFRQVKVREWFPTEESVRLYRLNQTAKARSLGRNY